MSLKSTMHTSLGMTPCQCGRQPRLVASAEPLRFYTCHHLSWGETRGLDHPKSRDGNAHSSHSQQPIVARVEAADAEQAVVFCVSLCVFVCVRHCNWCFQCARIKHEPQQSTHRGMSKSGLALASMLEVGKFFWCQMPPLINSCLWHQL